MFVNGGFCLLFLYMSYCLTNLCNSPSMSHVAASFVCGCAVQVVGCSMASLL